MGPLHDRSIFVEYHKTVAMRASDATMNKDECYGFVPVLFDAKLSNLFYGCCCTAAILVKILQKMYLDRRQKTN